MTSISSSIPPQVPKKIKDIIVSSKPGSYERFKKIERALSNPTTLKAYELWSSTHRHIISKYQELQLIDGIANGILQRIKNNDYVSTIIMKVQNTIGYISGVLGVDNKPEINEVNPLIGSSKLIYSIAEVEEKFLEYDMGIIALPNLVEWLSNYPEWEWMKKNSVVVESMSHIFSKLQFHEIKSVIVKDPINEVWGLFAAKLGDNREAKIDLIVRLYRTDKIAPDVLHALLRKVDEIPDPQLSDFYILQKFWPNLKDLPLEKIGMIFEAREEPGILHPGSPLHYFTSQNLADYWPFLERFNLDQIVNLFLSQEPYEYMNVLSSRYNYSQMGKQLADLWLTKEGLPLILLNAVIGTYLPQVAPVHALGKGMFSMFPEDEAKVSWENMQCKDFKVVSVEIQGVIDREEIADAFDISHVDHAEIKKKIGWLKEWILGKNNGATDVELSKLLSFISGSGLLQGKKIIVTSQSSNFLPVFLAHTCSLQIDMSPEPAAYGAPGSSTYFTDHTKVDLIRSLRELALKNPDGFQFA